jgi:hypothetical protein
VRCATDDVQSSGTRRVAGLHPKPFATTAKSQLIRPHGPSPRLSSTAFWEKVVDALRP